MNGTLVKQCRKQSQFTKAGSHAMCPNKFFNLSHLFLFESLMITNKMQDKNFFLSCLQ